MKKTYMIGIVVIAVGMAFAVFATASKPADQKLVRLKVGGKTIAELRLLDGGTFSLRGEKVNHIMETRSTIAKGATLQFGGAFGQSVTVKAEELEVLSSNE